MCEWQNDPVFVEVSSLADDDDDAW